jgi:hypothetical protein
MPNAIGNNARNQVKDFKEKASERLNANKSNNSSSNNETNAINTQDTTQLSETDSENSTSNAVRNTVQTLNDANSSDTQANNRVESNEKNLKKMEKRLDNSDLLENGWKKEVGENDQGNRTVSYTKDLGEGKEYELSLDPNREDPAVYSISEDGEKRTSEGHYESNIYSDSIAPVRSRENRQVFNEVENEINRDAGASFELASQDSLYNF